ncbi:hypothetical protein [Georgenia sp. AZ-5]|uniref:hypothetical protein n=1 Tax=Georgenia sp. AZ-5 TaxID=3367526 RepID=UPI003754CBFE
MSADLAAPPPDQLGELLAADLLPEDDVAALGEVSQPFARRRCLRPAGRPRRELSGGR